MFYSSNKLKTFKYTLTQVHGFMDQMFSCLTKQTLFSSSEDSLDLNLNDMNNKKKTVNSTAGQHRFKNYMSLHLKWTFPPSFIHL